MIKGIQYFDNFLQNPNVLYNFLEGQINWDLRMKSRKTASFGIAYNYSQVSYPEKNMIPQLEEICQSIDNLLNFRPNNCLLNLYPNGKSKMGFHSDQIDILKNNTGVVIISLGEKRVLSFRQILNKEIKFDYPLANGSLLYMNQKVQDNWQHSIPKDDTINARMSLTFRSIKDN